MQQALSKNTDRFVFIDYLRGVIVALVVVDHSLQAYASHFGQFWFLPDIDRNRFFDVFHMNNNSFIMPILFFLSGIFLIPSLERRGLVNFAKERFLRLGLPFMIGLPLLAPVVSYAPVLAADFSGAPSYTEFWVDSMMSDNVQVGIFWFLYYLMLMIIIFTVIHKLLPPVTKGIGRFVSWMFYNPLKGFLVFCLISAIFLGVSDLIWGAPWFIGWGRVFHVQASRFMLLSFYFLVGVGLGGSQVLKDRALWSSLAAQWKKLLILTLIVGAAYISYTLSMLDEGVYNMDFRRFLRNDGFADETWDLPYASMMIVLARTSMHGIFCALQVLFCLSFFYRFFNGDNETLMSLSISSYGIYLIHESFVVWIHYWLYGDELPVFIKFLITVSLSLVVSWAIVQKIFLKMPGLKRIL